MESTTAESPPRGGAPAAAQAEVWDGVRAILAELVSSPPGAITPELRLDSQLGFDSLMMIELSVRLEERFDIVVPPNASPADLAIKTARDVARVVEELVAERATAPELARERSEVEWSR